jgi:hypothetical protein
MKMKLAAVLFSIMLMAGIDAAMTVPAPQTAPATTRPRRRTPPARDPHREGYVTAQELPDDAIPPAEADGNFIIGLTHPRAPEMIAPEGVPQGTIFNLTLQSTDSQIYPGIAREPGTFGTPDPSNPAKLIVTTSHPAPYTRRVAVYVPKQYVAGTAAPFIVGADGPDQSLFAALDHLIPLHKVPGLICNLSAKRNSFGTSAGRRLE